MANKTVNKVAWLAFGFLAVGVGLYPLMYLLVDGKMGLLNSKTDQLLADTLWNIAFYGHISFGGLALLSGWTQFSKRLRRNYLKLHRRLGIFYLVTVLISGSCGVYLAFHATGGWISATGFFFLGVLWIFFTLMAYRAILQGNVVLHGQWMIYSYAACFAAVTLRIWLPLLTATIGDFIPAYRIVAWLCWVPNLIFARYWIRRKGLSLG
ncbi:Predicted membrane protein [Robiginitalea myxolifaciens]|uniref:Predicted membrane protein n=1 Tax=Robiginitalea myxolifaciens TaxID=400055 RepID=A0A1I6HGD4_9FLAO|nr:DUF2306 domain-containing protein [Robiginitalea myxolifaciens]SFR53519.1 Predicted membrane protein [Robiginitalea myxolifaciens]